MKIFWKIFSSNPSALLFCLLRSIETTQKFLFNLGAPLCTKNCANPFRARFSLFYLDNKHFWRKCKFLIFSPLSDESVEISEKWSGWVFWIFYKRKSICTIFLSFEFLKKENLSAQFFVKSGAHGGRFYPIFIMSTKKKPGAPGLI